jgi:hypothetical protein
LLSGICLIEVHYLSIFNKQLTPSECDALSSGNFYEVTQKVEIIGAALLPRGLMPSTDAP